jgi:lipopolysaccharide transport system ATP-binding protein
VGSPAIRVRGLSKQYRIGAPSRPSGHLREALTDLVRAPFRRLARLPTASEEFWALRDVSLDVEHGEVLGVVGRNGAGKVRVR